MKQLVWTCDACAETTTHDAHVSAGKFNVVVVALVVNDSPNDPCTYDLCNNCLRDLRHSISPQGWMSLAPADDAKVNIMP